MDPNQIIADLIESNCGLCVLDKIHLPYARVSAGPAAKFGLGAELYLPDIDRAVLRKQAVHFLSSYSAAFPDKINQFLPDGRRQTVKFTGDPAPLLLADYEKIPVKNGYGALLSGEVDIGLLHDDVPPYQAHVLVNYPEYKELSFLSATLPTCNDSSVLNFDVLLECVLHWCAQCRPVHGSAGFSFIFAPSMQQNSVYALQMMRRFPGFNFLDGGRFLLEAGSVHNRIKCVNWLTILNDDLVSELGGIELMRKALEPVCKVHAYPGGVVIQAGDAPQLGDTYRGDIPAPYRMVAGYTRPVRFEGYQDGLFRVPDNLDDVAETLA